MCRLKLESVSCGGSHVQKNEETDVEQEERRVESRK